MKSLTPGEAGRSSRAALGFDRKARHASCPSLIVSLAQLHAWARHVLAKEPTRGTRMDVALDDGSVEDFARLMRHRPHLTMMVSREIARRSMQIETRVAGMAYKTARGCVITALKHFAEEHGERLPDGSARNRLRVGRIDRVLASILKFLKDPALLMHS